MSLTFNLLLHSIDVDPKETRLLRHAKGAGVPGMSHLRAWQENRALFERYQSTQPSRDRKFFGAPYWASFVATPDKGTLFVGLYLVARVKDCLAAFTCPLTGYAVAEGVTDLYQTTVDERLGGYEGKLLIDWGASARTWGQYADRREKPIIELRREDSEPAYPGHSSLLLQLSQVEALPRTWQAILASVRGVYLITCPKTREQYVGGAFAGGGFLSRWRQHAAQQGDAIGFRTRDPEDYRVSILEVAGSLMTDEDVAQMESRWKEKLQSRQMGLNRN